MNSFVFVPMTSYTFKLDPGDDNDDNDGNRTPRSATHKTDTTTCPKAQRKIHIIS